MKLCANLSFMFQEEEDLVARSVLILIFIFDIMTIARYRAAHQAGFSAVEVAHPYNEDMETLARVLKETGLKQVIRIPPPVTDSNALIHNVRFCSTRSQAPALVTGPGWGRRPCSRRA